MDIIPNSSKIEEDRIRDAYAKRKGNDSYSLLNPGQLFFIQERERRLLGLLRRRGFTRLSGNKILEVGCGTGFWLRQFINWGAEPQDLTGVDLLPDRVSKARGLSPHGVRIECGSAVELRFADGEFDIVFQSTVFSSVLDPFMKQEIAAEMLRVVKADGLILWYDFHMNNPRNPDVRGVKNSEIRQLFPDCNIQLSRITLAPPIVRMLAPYSWLSCVCLEQFKIFNTHYLGIIQKSSLVQK